MMQTNFGVIKVGVKKDLDDGGGQERLETDTINITHLQPMLCSVSLQAQPQVKASLSLSNCVAVFDVLCFKIEASGG
jgi:hypothetical protein